MWYFRFSRRLVWKCLLGCCAVQSGRITDISRCLFASIIRAIIEHDEGKGCINIAESCVLKYVMGQERVTTSGRTDWKIEFCLWRCLTATTSSGLDYWWPYWSVDTKVEGQKCRRLYSKQKRTSSFLCTVKQGWVNHDPHKKKLFSSDLIPSCFIILERRKIDFWTNIQVV
jgi:hypothetical protein